MDVDEATEHPSVDEELTDLRQSLGSRLRERAAAILPPLPEDSWSRPAPPIQDEADPQVTMTREATADDRDAGSLFDPSEAAASTGSTSGKGRSLAEFRRGTAQVYGVLVGFLAGALGGLANMRLARDEDDPTWLMTEEESQDLGQPVGRILARRATLPIGDGDETNDVLDGIQFGVALVSYLGRNMMARANRKRPKQAPQPGDQAA